MILEQIHKVFDSVSPRVTPSNVSDLYRNYVLVESSNVHSFYYDPSSKELRVRFLPKEDYGQNGAEYKYFNFPERLFIALLNADSHGSEFWRTVRDKFRYERLADWTEV